MRMNVDVKKYLFRLLLIVLFLPWLQGTFKLIKVKELKGAVEKSYNPILNDRNWFEGRYQHLKEQYLNNEFGFRPSFVRLHNQIDFWLFDKLHAQSVIRGKENYLYEYNYIKTYYGLDYIGADSIRNRMHQIKIIQDSLQARNKLFLLVFAASKGQFYPEYFPDSSIRDKKTTNFEMHIKYAAETGVNFIDFNTWILSMKNKSPYPLYTKYGIHWSYYSACLVADSLLHYIEQKTNRDLPELEWKETEMAAARFDDNDIEKGLNLIIPLSGPKLAYPKIYLDDKGTHSKPKVTVVSDSYYWSLFNMGIGNAFASNAFWYYNFIIYHTGGLPEQIPNERILKKTLRDEDVIIVLATDANLYNLGWGFLENTSKLIDQNAYLKMDFEERLDDLKKYIPTDSVWIRDIRRKASEKGIPVDSMITLDAIWLIEHEKK